ncbi:MAG TPA: hypothetical protein VGJ63_03085 [Micromonosporaceae bacterium]|jgi:hypothetical protein
MVGALSAVAAPAAVPATGSTVSGLATARGGPDTDGAPSAGGADGTEGADGTGGAPAADGGDAAGDGGAVGPGDVGASGPTSVPVDAFGRYRSRWSPAPATIGSPADGTSIPENHPEGGPAGRLGWPYIRPDGGCSRPERVRIGWPGMGRR